MFDANSGDALPPSDDSPPPGESSSPCGQDPPPHRRVRRMWPSLPLNRRLIATPPSQAELQQMRLALRSEFDVRIFCMFNTAALPPEPGCPRPIRLAGRTWNSQLLRRLYAGRAMLQVLGNPPPMPEAGTASVPGGDRLDPLAATRDLLRPLMLDALLVHMCSGQRPLLEPRRVGPTLATLGMEFFLMAPDPARVIEDLADQLCRDGLLKGPSSKDSLAYEIFGPALAYEPTTDGRAKAIAEILLDWDVARVRRLRPRGHELPEGGEPEPPAPSG